MQLSPSRKWLLLASNHTQAYTMPTVLEKHYLWMSFLGSCTKTHGAITMAHRLMSSAAQR